MKKTEGKKNLHDYFYPLWRKCIALISANVDINSVFDLLKIQIFAPLVPRLPQCIACRSPSYSLQMYLNCWRRTIAMPAWANKQLQLTVHSRTLIARLLIQYWRSQTNTNRLPVLSRLRLLFNFHIKRGKLALETEIFQADYLGPGINKSFPGGRSKCIITSLQKQTVIISIA